MPIDEKLCEYATDRQAEAIRAYLAHGSCVAAAKRAAKQEPFRICPRCNLPCGGGCG